MAVTITTRWQAGDGDLDIRLIPLLRAIAKEGSLNRAVSSLQLSYRHAWGLLGKMESALGRSLVVMERGRGARLSPFAEKLLAADDAAAGILDSELGATVQALNRETSAARQRRAPKPLTVHASHDLALAELRDRLSGPNNVAFDLHFRGSLECLSSLARGECDLAGFHVPDTGSGSTLPEQYQRWLKLRALRIVHFVTRQQGLIMARGNPLHIRSLADVVRTRARFVNRQPGSGTRLLFDSLLAASGIRPAQINGYALEEFTHAAVAATIASGMTDAGFGIEAAARRQRLDFVPIARERYYLAARGSSLAKPSAAALLKALQSGALRPILRRLPGYTAPRTFEPVPAREIFA
jgi:molybdate transport repressor ModE-like protein